MTGDVSNAPSQLGIEDKVAFLSQAANYPEPTDAMDVVETHMSWVFLTDAHAYKLKKPVRYAFLDFTTLNRRRHDCEEELRLNRRLARGVYLGLVALRRRGDGSLFLDPHARDGQPAVGGDDKETVVDWLVKMKRLPADRALDRAIEDGTVRDDELRAVARLLAGFYRDAPRVATTPAAYKRRLADEVRVNAHELSRRDFRLPVERVQRLCARQLDFLETHGDLVRARAAERRIVEGHGDLRPEHVYLGPKPVIMDCLEFRRAFRILDPTDELAFLAMECDRLGMPRVGPILYGVYGEVTGDRPAPILVTFYKSFRAGLRAKLAIWHLKEVDPRDGARWRGQALSYLDLAEGYIANMGKDRETR